MVTMKSVVVDLIWWWMKTLWRVDGGGGDGQTQVDLIQTPLNHLRLRSHGAVQSIDQLPVGSKVK